MSGLVALSQGASVPTADTSMAASHPLAIRSIFSLEKQEVLGALV